MKAAFETAVLSHADYAEGITYDPRAPQVYYNLGSDYFEHGLLNLAEAAFIKGIAIHPRDSALHLALGMNAERTALLSRSRRLAGSENWRRHFRGLGEGTRNACGHGRQLKQSVHITSPRTRRRRLESGTS